MTKCSTAGGSIDPLHRFEIHCARMFPWYHVDMIPVDVAPRVVWLSQNLVEASFDLFRYLLLGDQLKPWELHPMAPAGCELMRSI